MDVVAMDLIRSSCNRCGTCCQKGGPSFHLADRSLIEEGIILAKYLFTIRKGELVWDNVSGGLNPADSDIIKIKGRGETWTCCFYDEADCRCTIYENRPLECKLMKCWDTSAMERMYAKNRLTRADLISEVTDLWNLVADHQKRCDYNLVKRLAADILAGAREQQEGKLLEMIRYDLELRGLVVARGGLDADMLDFLFGRPLDRTIEAYGLKAEHKGQSLQVLPRRCW
jgi:Fe-S-cluster containining protein